MCQKHSFYTLLHVSIFAYFNYIYLKLIVGGGNVNVVVVRPHDP